ncbi:MAG: ABC transporter ATP-binding protein [Oscillospiraceae bacterium]
MTTPQNAVEIRNLTKKYKEFTLDNVSFTVPMGSIVGLIGENGAGKSTTLRCLLNLCSHDDGEVSVLGLDAVADEQAIKEDVGVVLDECSFHDQLTAVQVGKILSHVYQKWDKNLYADYLSKFDLPKNLFLKQFSRGMKMKLNIAAALSHHPRLLILDEATGGLDPVVRDEILDVFLEFIQDEAHAILVSSHITSDLEKIADYVVYLHKGRVTLSGEKNELLADHGRIAGSRAQLDDIPPSYILGRRDGQFGCEALIRHRQEFHREFPQIELDKVTLDELMVFTVKGDKKP